MHVVAGILRDAAGRVLLAQRPEGKQDAGCWEFPGGKVESGESPEAALARELHEELGIRARVGRRRIATAHGHILLDVRNIDSFDGYPQPREGQRLAWIEAAKIERRLLPIADRPAATSLCLPERYLITPLPESDGESRFLSAIEAALDAGISMIQLRLPGWSRERMAPLARRVRDICRAGHARMLLNRDWQLAGLLGLDGVHLPAHIARTLPGRPLADESLIGVSCHNLGELAHAADLGADFATLSPLHVTATHPEAAAMGWDQAEAMLASARLPVYVLGGVESSDQDRALMAGFQGIAAVRAFWSQQVRARRP